MNLSYLLYQLTDDVDDFKMTVKNGCLYFEGNGMVYDGFSRCHEEALIQAISFLKAPKIMKYTGKTVLTDKELSLLGLKREHT